MTEAYSIMSFNQKDYLLGATEAMVFPITDKFVRSIIPTNLRLALLILIVIWITDIDKLKWLAWSLGFCMLEDCVIFQAGTICISLCFFFVKMKKCFQDVSHGKQENINCNSIVLFDVLHFWLLKLFQIWNSEMNMLWSKLQFLQQRLRYVNINLWKLISR